MTEDQLYAIIGSNVVAVAVVSAIFGTIFWRTVARLDRRIDEAGADRRAFQARSDADRGAFQAGMDDFRKEMQRLPERQSHLEGARTAVGD